MSDRLSTGIQALDRQFDDGRGQGIPAGSLTVIETPPGFQYEPVAWSFMGERPSVYVVTLRTEAAIEDDLAEVVPFAEYEVRDVGFDTPVRNTNDVVDLVDREANVILDTVNPLERVDDEDRYVKFLNGLKNRLVNTGGVGLLFATGVESSPAARDISLTIADNVWELKTEVLAGTVENTLVVRKFRGGQMPEQSIKLLLGQEVQVDTSRDIA